MSNSPLVDYTRISPNKNSPRNHKIDTITAADQIVVLNEEGRVAQIGTHAELYSQADGQYRAFWDARSRAAGWKLV